MLQPCWMHVVSPLCDCVGVNVAGMGDMAVSNSIGSNIFDVLLGLGFPWALRTLIVSYGSVVKRQRVMQPFSTKPVAALFEGHLVRTHLTHSQRFDTPAHSN